VTTEEKVDEPHMQEDISKEYQTLLWVPSSCRGRYYYANQSTELGIGGALIRRNIIRSFYIQGIGDDRVCIQHKPYAF
jgi:hypothetical protein